MGGAALLFSGETARVGRGLRHGLQVVKVQACIEALSASSACHLIRRRNLPPPPNMRIRPCLPAVQARVVVLFSSGLVAVFDLDQQGDLWATHVTASAWAARVGRVTDVQWLPLPRPIGG